VVKTQNRPKHQNRRPGHRRPPKIQPMAIAETDRSPEGNSLKPRQAGRQAPAIETKTSSVLFVF
jgi:hypothetical protein